MNPGWRRFVGEAGRMNSNGRSSMMVPSGSDGGFVWRCHMGLRGQMKTRVILKLCHEENSQRMNIMGKSYMYGSVEL